MDVDFGKSLAAFGFLTVVESSEHGLFGGYLVLSPLGRPLEFRCSTPVQPSQAERILYGPTLRPYLYGEVIGQALVEGSSLPVRAILTDDADVLLLGSLCGDPVFLVEPPGLDSDAAAPPLRRPGSRHAPTCILGEYRLTGHESRPMTAAELEALLAPLAIHVDLCEPFERIRAALREAQTASHDGGLGQDGHVAAA